MTVLDRRALNRALLARQLLLARRPGSASAVLEHLVGMQAQAPDPPYIGLWTRLAGFAAGELSELIRGRAAVRLALMRGTIHLVTARDCLSLRPVLQSSLDRQLTSTFGRRLEGLDLDEVTAYGRKLSDAERLTLGGLGALLAERWPGYEPFALANVVRARVPLVQLPPRGLWGESGQAVHGTAETWLGRPLDTGTAPDTLVRRYLAAFGPATVKDVQAWSGMTRIGAVVKRLRPELRVFRDENGAELYDVPDAPLPDPATPAPVRFLPEFDNILLGHADRGRILTEEQRRLVFTRNGLIRSTVLVDGFVRALWRIEDGALVVEPLGRALARRDRTAVEREGRDLLAFAAPGLTHPEIRWV
ncbi:winged helix DNA-binding domain-containing protein [Streptomyces sp. NPDC001851]|uniref:winged helix DNA-binding domain-containing protein n=1 Tax=Streptomyces sp. NPDC001851 TaxID=3154529 RepID=UPI003328CF97